MKKYIDLEMKPTQHYKQIDGEWVEIDEEGSVITTNLAGVTFEDSERHYGTVTKVRTYPYLSDKEMMMATGNWFQRIMLNIKLKLWKVKI